MVLVTNGKAFGRVIRHAVIVQHGEGLLVYRVAVKSHADMYREIEPPAKGGPRVIVVGASALAVAALREAGYPWPLEDREDRDG